MKIAYAGLILLFCLVSVLRADVTYGGGNGADFKSAIIIQGAKDESEGVKSEYAYLAIHFPHYKMIQQSLKLDNNKSYDVLEFTAADGSIQHIYFDISGFFGKL